MGAGVMSACSELATEVKPSTGGEVIALDDDDGTVSWPNESVLPVGEPAIFE